MDMASNFCICYVRQMSGQREQTLFVGRNNYCVFFNFDFDSKSVFPFNIHNIRFVCLFAKVDKNLKSCESF